MKLKAIRKEFGDEIANTLVRIHGDLLNRISGFNQITGDMDDLTIFFYVVSGRSLEEVKTATFAEFVREDCECVHDCCDCYFRNTVKVWSAHDREGIAYYILDTWSRNI
jgi:hypothetical protein